MSTVARPAVTRSAESRTSAAEAIVVTAISPLASAFRVVVLGSAFTVEGVRVAEST